MEAACDAHSDARLGVLLRHAIDSDFIMTAPHRTSSPRRHRRAVIDDGLHTQATIGAAVKESVLAAARCVAVRLCAQIGRTHVVDQIIEDAKARGKRADAQLDASIREKLAQIVVAEGRSEAMKRKAEELERAIESLKRAKP